MDLLKIGVVGVGKVARNSYLPYLSQAPGVTLGYLSRTQAKAESAASDFGGQAFESVAALMAWKPDTVFVLTREMDRFSAAMALLEHHPRRLFFEKPLVARSGQENVTEQDFADGRRLMQEAEAQGCETAMIFNYRFFDHTLLARRIASERDFGQVVSVVGQTHYACWSHCIDLIHHFAGPITEVSAQAGSAARSAGSTAGTLTAPDLAATFRTEAGASGTLLGTAALAWEYPLFELAFNFERGRVRMQDLDGDLEVMDSRKQEHERYGLARHRSRWDQYAASFRKSIAAYLSAVRQGDPPPVPGAAGLMELQVEAGFRRSIAEARPVRLAEEFPI
jgi:predicted dehydrogenase